MKLIALDLDGTLIDCRERQSLLAASLCRAAGLELDISQFWSAKREGATTAFAIKMQGADVRLADSLSKLWVDQIETDAWLRMDRVLPGVRNSLHIAVEMGFKLHMVTARAREQALRRQLRWLSLETFFDHVKVVSPRDPSLQKANYLSAIMPVVYIGDSESDAAAARAAQIKFLAVSSGQRTATYMQTHANLSAEEIKSDINETIEETLYENR